MEWTKLSGDALPEVWICEADPEGLWITSDRDDSACHQFVPNADLYGVLFAIARRLQRIEGR